MSSRNQLSEEETPLWDEACVLFNDMLEDFDSKNLLRRGIIPIDIQNLSRILKNGRNYGKAFNEFFKKFESKETIKKLMSDSGLTDLTLTYLFVSQMVGTALIYYESVFKTGLIFFLEEKYGIRKMMTLGQLLGVVESISPSIGARLKAMIDTKLRNSLAHGTFWFQEGKIFLASNSYLEDAEVIELHDFWVELRRLTIVGVALIETLHEKIKEGYFRL